VKLRKACWIFSSQITYDKTDPNLTKATSRNFYWSNLNPKVNSTTHPPRTFFKLPGPTLMQPRLVAQRQRQGFIWVRVSACTPVTPAVSYLPTGLAGCSVGPGISCGARKLARTPRVKKKKKELQWTPATFFFIKKKQLECNNYEMRSGQLAQRSEWLSTNKKMQTKMGWSNILKRKGKCREAGPRNAWCIQVWNVGNTCSACFCALQMGPPCSYEHPWLFL